MQKKLVAVTIVALLLLATASLTLGNADGARILKDDFENGYTKWTGTQTSLSGTISIDDSQAYHGTYSSKCFTVGTAGNTAWSYKEFSPMRTVNAEYHLMFSNLPTGANDKYTSGLEETLLHHPLSYFGYEQNRWVMSYWNNGAMSYAYANSPTLETYTWYTIKTVVTCSSANGEFDGSYQAWINGKLAVSVSGINTQWTSIGCFDVGCVATNWLGTNIWIDTVAVSNK